MVKSQMNFIKTLLSILIMITFYSVLSYADSTKGPSEPASKAKGNQKIELNNFLILNGKSIPVLLIKSENRWEINFPDTVGANVNAPMEKGAIIELMAKSQKNGHVSWDFNLKQGKEKVSFIVRKLPGERLAPVLLGTKLYSERFRLVYEFTAEMAATGKTPLKSALYFIDEPTEPPL